MWPSLAVLLSALLLCACRTANLPEGKRARVVRVDSITANLTDTCVENYRPDLDYFPDKTRIRWAKQFQVEYGKHYKVVSFRPTVQTGETLQYLLVQCGTPARPDYPGALVVPVPAFRLILDDPAYGSSIVRIGALDHLAGVNNTDPYSTPEIYERIRAGTLVNTGSQGHSTIETTLDADPDMIFTFYSAYPQHNLHPRIRETGIPAVPLAGHFEPEPLGFAEWTKFVALFLNREAKAEEVFREAETKYVALTDVAQFASSKPTAMLGFPSDRETWTLNGSNNFMAEYIRDAGGRYLWVDDDYRSLVTANFEKVFDVESDVDIWVGHAYLASTMAAVIKDDERLLNFRPIPTRRVYSPNIRGGPANRILFRDQSVTHPHDVLADLIHIFHPDLIPGHRPVFYRRVQ